MAETTTNNYTVVTEGGTMEVSTPTYSYTYEILNFYFEIAHMEIKYYPDDERLTSIVRNIPITDKLDPENLSAYVENWAPHSSWFAQELILNHEDQLRSQATSTKTTTKPTVTI